MPAAPERTREERFLSWVGREGRELWDAFPTVLPVAAGLLFTVSTLRSEKLPGAGFFWAGAAVTLSSLAVGLLQKPSRGELQRELEIQRRERENDAEPSPPCVIPRPRSSTSWAIPSVMFSDLQ